MRKKRKKSCEGCGGKCCRYAAVEIETPKSIDAFEELVFYIYHGGKVSVGLDGNRRQWLLEFGGACRHLNGKGMCRIYEHRPQVCREHEVEECEHHNAEDIRDIATVEELMGLMKEIGRGEWVKGLRERIGPGSSRKSRLQGLKP